MLMGVDPRLVVGVVDLFMDLYKEAKRLLEERELDSSFRLFTDFIESQKFLDRPQYVEELRDAYNSRGHIRYMWVKFDEAVVDYSKAIELDSEFAVAYYNRGQVHYRLGNNNYAAAAGSCI